MSNRTMKKHFYDEGSYNMWKDLIESGIINIQQIQVEMEMKKNQELLSMHTYAIYQGEDGKYYTHFSGKGKYRIKRRRNTRKEIEQLVIDYWREQTENPTLQEVFDEWNDYKLRINKIVPATHSRNKRDFARYYSEIKDKKIRSVSPLFIEEYIEQQISKHELTVKAFSNLRTITKGFFKRAYKNDWIDFNIENVFAEMDLSDRMFKKVVKEDYEEVFDEEETEKMISYLSQNLDLHNLGILLMFVTGIRVGELVALKHEDFNGNTIRIRRTETKYKDAETGKDVYAVADTTKTEAGMRTAIIPPDFAWLAQKIKLQNPFGDFIFYDKGKRMTTNCIRQRMYRVCKKVGVHPKSPHKARKTYGTILIDSGIDTKMITELMGHTNILCTEQHYHRNRKTLAKKTEILGNIREFKTK